MARALYSLAGVLLFALLLPAGAASAVLQVAVISDLNGSYGSTAYEPGIARDIDELVKLRPDLVISTGDMVAGQRLHPLLQRQAVELMWASFHAQVTDPLRTAGIPFAVTPGNHDASAYAAFALERRIYREQWLEQSLGLQFVDRENFPFNYAFALGDVLFISLDVTRVGALVEDQRLWLNALLQREGGNYRHRVAFGHLPVYPFTQGRETEVTADHELERILQLHGVELYLSGHHHAFYPGFHGGVRHIGQACLGAGPRKLIGTSRVAPRAVTWLVFEENDIRITALTGSVLDQTIDISTLPESIVSPYGTLIREDLRHTEPGRPAEIGIGSSVH